MKHTLKILCKCKHFNGDIKENVSGCFFSEHSVVVEERSEKVQTESTMSSSQGR